MDLLPISALQHLLYCERQCALIHLEQVWAENPFTVEGNLMHEKAHDGPDETKAGVRIVRGLPVKSDSLGLTGQCDVVEFRVADAASEISDLRFQMPAPPMQAMPIEYKRGKPKAHRADEVQLCAQAMCLEEMLSSRVCKDVESSPVCEGVAVSGHPLAQAATGRMDVESSRVCKDVAVSGHLLAQAATGRKDVESSRVCEDVAASGHLLAQAATVTIPEGRLFYGQTRRRVDVIFDAELRALTVDTVQRLREMIASRRTPPAVYEARKCDACSLKELCMPQAMRFQKGAGAWFRHQISNLKSEI